MRDRRVLLAVGLVALFAFAASYYVSVARPGPTSPDGYFGWADQHNYRLEARALADGVLPGIDYNYRTQRPKPSYDPRSRPLYDYAYGLGYPLLAVPSALLGMRSDPFVLPDALIFVAEVAIVVVLGTRLRSLTFGLLTAAALVFATPLLDFTVIPWNTSVTTLAILVALLVATDPEEHPVRNAVLLGAAVGLCFAARYVDAVFPAAIGGFGILLRRPPTRTTIRSLCGAAAIAAALAVPVLWSQAVVFGSPFTTPYAHHVRDGTNASDQSLGAFDPGRAPRSFTEVFVTGDYNGVRTQGDPMLAAFPWIVFAPLGFYAFWRERRALRRLLTLAAIVSVVGSTFYLSFWAGTGHDLVFHNLRYFVMWVPLWALLAANGVAYAGGRIRDRIEGDGVRRGREPDPPPPPAARRAQADLGLGEGQTAPLAQPATTVSP